MCSKLGGLTRVFSSSNDQRHLVLFHFSDYFVELQGYSKLVWHQQKLCQLSKITLSKSLGGGKSSISAYSTLSINATKWFAASWAREKGLFSEVYDTNEEMDQGINKLAENLTNSNPEAMKKLKEVIWSNTDNWDELLEKRAEYSGQLVLSDFTKNAIARFKSK